MMKSGFTQYCIDVVLPVYLVLKNGDKHEVYEALQSFDNDNIFTTVYSSKIRRLEVCITAKLSKKEYDYRHELLLSSLITELNSHNRYFPNNKISNPLS